MSANYQGSLQPDQQSLSNIIEKFEGLADAVTGIEAKMLCCFDSLAAKITALQSELPRVILLCPKSCQVYHLSFIL